MMGSGNRLYHYTFFDPEPQYVRELSIFRLDPKHSRLRNGCSQSAPPGMAATGSLKTAGTGSSPKDHDDSYGDVRSKSRSPKWMLRHTSRGKFGKPTR